MSTGFSIKNIDIESSLCQAPARTNTYYYELQSELVGSLGELTNNDYSTADATKYIKYRPPTSSEDVTVESLSNKWANTRWLVPEYGREDSGTFPAAFGSTPLPRNGLSGNIQSLICTDDDFPEDKNFLYFLIKLQNSDHALMYCSFYAKDREDAAKQYKNAEWVVCNNSRNISSIIVHLVAPGGDGSTVSSGGAGGGGGGTASFILTADIKEDGSLKLDHTFIIDKQSLKKSSMDSGARWFPRHDYVTSSTDNPLFGIQCSQGKDASYTSPGAGGNITMYSPEYYPDHSKYVQQHICFIGPYIEAYNRNKDAGGCKPREESGIINSEIKWKLTPLSSDTIKMTQRQGTVFGSTAGLGGESVFNWICARSSTKPLYTYGRGGDGATSGKAQSGCQGGVIIQYQGDESE